ncbi:MFS transporter [Pyxidicoccus fallax]|uniref:MFS transporter n=1 Tax=Pyxidicoccus fallax TaxID=394095 RepID=A0A848LM95_9BACT|nr:MFS transporter [Pyxidicoccus fallax]NMO18945.1 MFS transporter [Pyxidicoccus fallax]NPC80183.1 MFS transporter [Pyxidicoccus fallax]
MTSTVASPPAGSSALRIPGYRTFLITFMLAMMADNIEHVISYWVAFQKFHSAALGGFAVVSHWLPFLMFSVPVGALNDRFDSRRLIQAGMVLFIGASLGWGYFFVTDSLQMWHAMVLLTLHGCAGVLWSTSSQMLLYDIVGPASLASAVRLNATARYLGVLVGPGVGSLIMQTLGPTRGIFVNTLFYLPLLLWLVGAPYGRHFRGAAAGPKRAVRGIADIVQTLRDVRGLPVVSAMVLLAGAASFFIGNSYQAQMPGFAHDLGHGDPGMTYTLLLGADAAGALLAGVLLETRGTWLPTTASSALRIAFLWGCSLLAFSFMSWYPAAICVLFVAGFLELSFSSMTQAIVQLNAPDTIRGRVLGLFSMSALGLRAFSGVTVGLLGSVTNTHVSLALSAVAFVAVAGILLLRQRQQAA